MIASVTGTVAARRPDHVVVECGGVGYRLNVSAQTLAKVPASGGETRLHSHLLARDDGLHLYGFATEEERELFLALVSVAGVGPKMALAVLSGSGAGALRRAIASGDAKRFQVVPGVGRKTAERIIVELREKIADGLGADLPAAVANGTVDGRALAREGLVGLGYELAEADAMLEAVPAARDPSALPEELIAAALRTAAGGGATR
jgi:Holliday junction DNA helicase RuvA